MEKGDASVRTSSDCRQSDHSRPGSEHQGR